jgi:hypothetical protein
LITVDFGLAYYNVSSASTNADVGEYIITLTANDPYGDTIQGTHSFNVTVTTNQGPVVGTTVTNTSVISRYGLNQTLPAVIFIDPEGEAMSYAYTVTPATALITVETGSLAYYNVSSSSDNLDAGTYVIQLFANDIYIDTSQGTYSFQVVITPNQGPTVNNTVTNETVSVWFGLNRTFPTGIFEDPEGEPMTYSYTVTPATPLIIVETGSLLYYNVSDASTNADIGVYVIQLTADDPYPDTPQNSHSFSISLVLNQGPIVNETVTDFTFSCERSNSFYHTTFAFSDPESEAVYLDGSFSPAAPFLAYNNVTREIYGTPTDADSGTYMFTLIGYDIHFDTINASQSVSDPNIYFC